MKKLQVIPRPNKASFTDGHFALPENEDIESFIKTSLDEKADGEEYALVINEDGIMLTAAGDRGFFYARQTLKQILNQYGHSLPYMSIIDKPRYAYRGFMLDCSRHFFEVEELKKIIEAASLFKLNAFHWHLSDDHGFRVQIDKYPLLTVIGSNRNGDNFGSFLRDKEPHGGYYTKKQIKEIVDFCRERFIEVIPEIDMPGHASAILAAYPEYSCTGAQVEVKTVNRIFSKETLCPGKEKTIKLVTDILSEIIELFPGRYVHIGGDETPKDNWKKCPHCQKRMKCEALANEEELQSYFTNRVADFLESKGKKAIVWNEALNGGKVVSDVLVQQWKDKKGEAGKWANAGKRTIVSEHTRYYADYPFAVTPLKKTYSYEPSRIKNLDEIGKRYIYGIEMPVWTEFISTFEKLCRHSFPRFCAVAESGWTVSELKNYEDFMLRVISAEPMLKNAGIAVAPVCEWDPDKKGQIIGSVEFSLKRIPRKISE